MGAFSRFVMAVLVASLPAASFAQEASAYSYDAQGRLSQTSVTGGPRNGQASLSCYDRAGNRISYTVAAAPPACPTPPSFYTGVISAETDILPNNYVISPDGRFKLIYQTNGNLILYMGATILWQSSTAGTTAGRAVFDSTGRLTIYNAAGNSVWLWSPYTAAGGPYGYLEVRNDGNVKAYDGTGAMVWQTNTCCH